MAQNFLDLSHLNFSKDAKHQHDNDNNNNKQQQHNIKMSSETTTPITTNVIKITTPTFLVDKSRCLKNIRRMAAKATTSNVRFRPHCKTHASIEIGKWLQKEASVECITVSSLSMAKYFVNSNTSEEEENNNNHHHQPIFNDITVAFPLNILEIDTINEILSYREVQLNLLVENKEAIIFLEQNVARQVGIYVKIDVGYGRTGIPAQDYERIDTLLQLLISDSPPNQKLQFKGFLAHAGHSYHCHSREELLQIHNTSKDLLLTLKQQCQNSYPNTEFELSIGDTPTCSIIESDDLTDDIQEIRPGNFVFYDVEQSEIGSCTYDDIAVSVACPIVATHPNRRELILYGGGVHFAKDRVTDSKHENRIVYGRVVRSIPNSLYWGSVIDGMYLRSLSQEHGIVVVPPEEDFNSYKVGDILKVLPVHSCMTADVMKHKGYLTCDGEWISRMKD